MTEIEKDDILAKGCLRKFNLLLSLAFSCHKNLKLLWYDSSIKRQFITPCCKFFMNAYGQSGPACDAFGNRADSPMGKLLISEGKYVPSELPEMLTERFRVACREVGIHEAWAEQIYVKFNPPHPYDGPKQYQFSIFIGNGLQDPERIKGTKEIGVELMRLYPDNKDRFITDDGNRIIVQGNDLQDCVDMVINGFVKKNWPESLNFQSPEIDIEEVRREHLENARHSVGRWSSGENLRDANRRPDFDGTPG